MAVHEIARRLIGGVWRTVDVEEDGGGNGGSQTPPVTFTGTDPDEAVLTLRADDAQTEHIFRVYDEAGDLSVDIDKDGVLDTRQVVVQDPPDTGAGENESAANLRPASLAIVSGGDTSNPPFRVSKWEFRDEGWHIRERLNIVYADSAILECSPIANEVSVTVVAPLTPTGNAIELWDHAFNNLLYAVTYGGGVIFPSADPHVAGAWWDNAGTLTRSAG